MKEHRRTERRIQIVHESLLTKWPRLVRWQTQDAEGAQLRDELRQAAQLWDQHGRSQDLLWTGSTFREFELWHERYPGGLSAIEEAFAGAMCDHARRRRQRRRMALAATIGVLIIGLTVVGWLWRRAETARERAEASKLVVLGERELESYPTAALAYAIKSLEVADTEAGRLLALRVLQQGPLARIARVGEGDAEGAYALSLAFSPDGEWVATGGYTKSEVLHRDGQRRLVLGAFDSLGQRIVNVAFTARSDGLVANQRGEVRVWSIPEGRELRRDQIDRGPSFSVIRDDDFVTGTLVERKWVFRSWPDDGSEPRLLGRMDPFRGGGIGFARGTLVFADGTKLCLQSLDDLDAPPRVVAELPAEIGALNVSPDGRLVTAESSGSIRVWATDSYTDAPLRVLEGEPGFGGLALGPGGRWLAEYGMRDAHPAIRLWDLDAPHEAVPMTLRRGEDAQFMNHVRFDPQDDWLATGHANNLALWWLGGDYPRVLRGGGALAFTPDGHSLVAVDGDGMRVWRVAAEGVAEPTVLIPGDFEGLRMAIDPRGRSVAVAGDGGRLYVVPLDGSPATELEGFSSRVANFVFAFSPDGRRLAAAPWLGPAEEKVIRVFDLETGDAQVLGPIPGVGEGYGVSVVALRFAAPDRLLAGVGGTGVVSVDLKTGAASVLVSWPLRMGVFFNHALTGGVSATTSRPDVIGQTTFNQPIRFRLDGSAPEPLLGRGVGSLFRWAAFDPSDRILATASDDGVIRVGPADGGEPHLLLGHTGIISDLVFSPDGHQLASSSWDGTIRLWRVPDTSEPPLHTLPLDILLAKLRTHTNLRAVPDPASQYGYKLDLAPFPGWASPPER